MSGNQEVREQLERIRQDQADNDLMLQAYGRFWLPYVKRAVEALESQAKSLTLIVRILSDIRDGKAGNDDK